MSGLTSVWTGNDHDLLLEAIPFYLRSPVDGGGRKLTIVDATWGNGTFWRGRTPPGWRVVGMDSNAGKRAEVRADNRWLPVRDASVDVVVYDPPFVTHRWSEWSQMQSYGYAVGKGSVGYLFPAFVAGAARALRQNGILLCKMADQVHSGYLWPQTLELQQEIEDAPGLTLCDVIIKVRPSARPQPAGRRRLHAERRHSTWLVARKGKC